MEIERKYEIKNLPGSLSEYREKIIEQGYLCHNPTIRIRKSNDDYMFTYKSKFGIEQKSINSAIINNEVELPLTEEAYYVLRGKTDGNMIYKSRYLVPLEGGLIAELDIFDGKLKGLVFVEVEFPDEESANNFSPPDWFGAELSADKRYSNYHLSKLEGIEELKLKIDI